MNRLRTFVLVSLSLSATIQACHKPEVREPFTIVIQSSNYSMAYSTRSTITDSLIRVEFVGGLVDETPKLLWQHLLNRTEADTLYAFLNHESFDTLKESYDNPAIFDGMQYFFRIHYRGATKTTQLGNVWVPELLRLTLIANRLLPDTLRFHTDLPIRSNAP